jgi:predicted glycosyltransferase
MKPSVTRFSNAVAGKRMQIWYDACTGKHVRYGTAIARRLRKLGHEVIFTTREHPDTVTLAKTLGEKPIVVGKYDPTSLFTRLEESANRMLQFSSMFKDSPPELAISHQSVELCRSAFALNIPIIVTADTPHAEAVNRLTMPLASALLISEAIPKILFKKYGPKNIVQFKGVDEVAWARDSNRRKTFGFKRPLIVVRQMEMKAAYALGKTDVTIDAAKKLSLFGTVVFLPRYSKPKNRKLTIIDGFIDSANLAAQSDLVVSVGGTIAREAALQGTPSIVISEFGRIQVNEYLSKKGFPLFIVESSRVLACAKQHLGEKFDVTANLAKLENPVDVIERILLEKQFA